MSKANVFISYAREDSRWLNEESDFSLMPWLQDSLRNEAEIWFDQALAAGERYQERIEEKIESANIALLLISQSFLNSQFIASVEFPRIRAKADAGEMIVIPILVEPCAWKENDFLNARQMMPGAPTPLIDYTVSLRDWAHVKHDVLEAIKEHIRLVGNKTSYLILDDIGDKSASSDPSGIAEHPRATLQRLRPNEKKPLCNSAQFRLATMILSLVLAIVTIVFGVVRPRVLKTSAAQQAIKGEPVALQQTLSGHTQRVTSLAFSPDGKVLASGSWDRTVQLWNVSTGECVRTLSSPTGCIYSVAYSPDGNLIASASDDKTAKLWEARTGKLKAVLTGHSDVVYCLAFSRSGASLATGSDDATVKLWNLRNCTNTHTLVGHKGSVITIAFSPDGLIVASGSSDGAIRIWDAGSGQQIAILEGHTDWVASLAFSPDGTMLASGSGDKSINLWDVSTGTRIRTIAGHTEGVRAIVFSYDGSRIASTGRDGTIRLWDVATGKQESEFDGGGGVVWSIALSPDGTTLATVSQDRMIRLWRLTL